ncbi:cytochrome c oxidase subunit 5A, mitochondrial-like isoform X2 [Acanthaster planci]|uniref:Cytochrome c oxidase subunit 5A, mitochondrial n=1 Tax=Acanthaster planci TaxID=133434 RepID=A0A8B8A582_ACAPL|nr:cytochrome c oxidase subunit 5A, mitochondrial-like isoform X1 [Acanthaster planci]XP_022111101.1 cytochrome c oxidase subunit 5A, mitochondrial-like isoform X2 [Acanthaster planci]
MFRKVVSRIVTNTRTAVSLQACGRPVVASQMRSYSSKKEETDEQFDARWEAYFNRPEIDDWELRRGLNELHGHDLVPEPKIVAAALKACRRLDDIAMTVRILEAVKDKAGGNKNIYLYILQEVQPTLDELGISTPEELGLDVPQQNKIM